MKNIEIGQTIHLSDVTFPKGVESVELGKGEEHDLAVVTVKTAKGPSVEEDADDAAEGEADTTAE